MIELKNVTKDYGSTVALKDFSIKISEPAIYCLLGLNGAGKTTFCKSTVGHVAPTSGEITVNGRAVKMLAMPEDAHYVESNAVHFNTKLSNLLKAAESVNPSFDGEFALHLAARFKLDLNKRYKQLSFGMRAMINAVIALASGKGILILDEPVLGFDPLMRKTFYELLQTSQAEKPKIIIVSTHIIDEIAKVAEKLIIIDKGRLILYCGMDEIDEKAYSVTGVSAKVTAATEGLRILGETKAGGFLSRYIYDERIKESDGYSISSLGLQDFFVGLVGNEQEEL